MRGICGATLVALLLTACLSPEDVTPSGTSASPSATPLPSATAPAAGPLPAKATRGLRTAADVAFTSTVSCGTRPCAIPLDVLAPRDAHGAPTVVLVPGGPLAFSGRRYLLPLAVALAKGGAVVFLVTYRSKATGNFLGDTVSDLQCAVRFARESAAQYGGDGERIVYVGHSYGSNAGLELVLGTTVQTPDTCLAEGRGLPNAFVGVAGYAIPVGALRTDAPRIHLLGGSEDTTKGGADAAAYLNGQEITADYREVKGLGHMSLVDPELDPVLVRLILNQQ